jgi:hypothetical protein
MAPVSDPSTRKRKRQTGSGRAPEANRTLRKRKSGSRAATKTERRERGLPTEPRLYTYLHSFRCTHCEAILLSLWRHKQTRDWHTSKPAPCVHVSEREIETYRFTSHGERAELELPIRIARRRRG